jgi:hypothetical protein
MDSNGKSLDTTAFQKFLEQQKEAEHRQRDLSLALARIYFPLTRDVVMGRGRPFQEFPGNVRLRMNIDLDRERYESAMHGEKLRMCAEVVHMMKASGGRFLKQNESKDGWEEVGEGVALDKVSHTFRSQTKRNAPRPLAKNGEGAMIFATKEGNKRARSSPSSEIEGSWKALDPVLPWW